MNLKQRRGHLLQERLFLVRLYFLIKIKIGLNKKALQK